MVKNTTGGNKSKGQARKHITSKNSRVLRTAKEEGEIYAIVDRIIGGGQLHVFCDDNKTRLGIIRGKFKGRGKRDNIMNVGTFVLIGLRDFASTKEGDKLEQCDILEVYQESEKEQLRKFIDWTVFSNYDKTKTGNVVSTEDNIEFTNDETNDEYETLMINNKTEKFGLGTNEQINIDDI